MILVTQGSEPSIGLEVFFKSFLSVDKLHQGLFKLFASKELVKKTLESMKIPHSLEDDRIEVSKRSLCVTWVGKESPTLNSLLAALSKIKSKDTLITLPSDKKSFALGGNNYSGYTQFFRHHFNKHDLCMVFKGKLNSVGLITDHIPLNEVPTIDSSLIVQRARTVLTSIDQKSTQNILFSGLNPHCGESGLMGNEDEEIIEAMEILRDEFKDKIFYGPLPADTIWKHKEFYKNDSFTFFMYHDQGLGVFKTRNELIGANVTYGLDFVRMSVDHGTAPDIAYKNLADYRGCLFVVKEALKREIEQ